MYLFLKYAYVNATIINEEANIIEIKQNDGKYNKAIYANTAYPTEMCFLKEKIHIKYRITENDLIKNKTASLLEPHTNFNSKHNTPNPGSTEYIEEKVSHVSCLTIYM